MAALPGSSLASCCVFYGWVIVALCIAIRVTSMVKGRPSGVTAFIYPL
jgi:hypothetical protein